MTYADKLKDPRWQRKRAGILARDNYTCRDCGNTTRTLHVHHCGYIKDPWDAPDEILLTVCDECHNERQEAEDRLRLNLAYLLSEMHPEVSRKLSESLAEIPFSGTDLSQGIVAVPAASFSAAMGALFRLACEVPGLRKIHDKASAPHPVDWESYDAGRSECSPKANAEVSVDNLARSGISPEEIKARFGALREAVEKATQQ